MEFSSKIQEYFEKLNPMSERIASDIYLTRIKFGKLWNNMSIGEQNEIINDTLIRPEISLHYFDNFPTPTQSNSTKSHTSTDSLDIVLRSFSKDDIKTANATEDKCGYGFDGRHLRTYSIQTVALKIIQDEVLGRFRDEHSRPFSYRTKSQINLHIFQSDSEDLVHKGSDRTAAVFSIINKDSNKEPKDAESKIALINYQRLQSELKKSLNHNIEKTRSIDIQNPPNINIKPSSITSPSSDSKTKNRCSSTKFESDVKKIKTKFNKTSSAMQSLLNPNKSSPSPPTSTIVNYAVYTDEFLDKEEKTNLMKHCGRNEFISASSSSAATSEDDEYDSRADKVEDSEEVYLLDRDLNMRKGFDFLNNW